MRNHKKVQPKVTIKVYKNKAMKTKIGREERREFNRHRQELLQQIDPSA